MLEKVGLADPAAPQAEQTDVICDPSIGSTCTRERLSNTLTAVFARAAARPGSRVRLWMLGATVETTELKAEIVSPPPSGKTARARAAEALKWKTHAEEVFLASVAGSFDEKHQPTSSPIAEAVTAVALADGYGLHRQIILISDGREMSVADFECGPLPSDASWTARLRKQGLLSNGLLTGSDVTFTYLTMPPIARCPVSLKRELRIRELWGRALIAAGAREVRMLSGPITYEERVAER